ncbi:FAD-binding oxidoreductase [Kribbella sp. NPDC051587]|uniref:FAD-binding oxidoreductase n=1 Tax=Kribbella sp. NPDC051587 TaxID=3364119 RepID=UPI0037A6701E
MTETNKTLIADLRRVLTGRVVAPDAEDWDAERRPWHTLVPQEPVAVVHAASVRDIQKVVRAAEWHRLAVSPQPRGHGATSHTADGSILLRLDLLDEITVERDVVRIGAGVAWKDLNAALAGTGSTSLPGSNGNVSVVGYTLSGGLSWFSRAYGQAAHSIQAIELVDAGGKARRVTADSDAQLFWALCGGGGDFGIVTAIEVRLHPAPHIYGGSKIWSFFHVRELVQAFTTVTDAAPDELTLWLTLLRMPDLDSVPEPLRGRAAVSVSAAYLGDADEAEKLLAPLYAVAEPELGQFGSLSIDQIDSISDEPHEPMPITGRAHLLTEFNDEVVDALLKEINRGDTPLAMLQIRHLGGALLRSTTTDGPSGAIDDPYLLLAAGVVTDPEQTRVIQQALYRVTAGVILSVSGRVPMTMAGDEPIEHIFAPRQLARLRDIKDRVDPHRRLRSNYPVWPRERHPRQY